MELKKKIVCIIVGAIVCFAAGFSTSYIIDKLNYTRSADRLEQLLGTGHVSSAELYKELERRIQEFDDITATVNGISDSISNCSDIAEQSGLAIGQLRGTVEELRITSSNIGDTIRQIREGQRHLKIWVGELEENNLRLKGELKELQSSVSKQ